MKTLNEIAKAVHKNAVEHGWWDCPTCDGHGKAEPTHPDSKINVARKCNNCNGIGKHRNVGESLALIHSEVSEALEAKRDPANDTKCDKCEAGQTGEYVQSCNKCKGSGEALGGSRFAEELADVVIRVMDLAVGEGIELEAVILRKHEYNKTRPRRHGKKF